MKRGNKRHIALAKKFWGRVELDFDTLSTKDKYRVLAQIKRLNPKRYVLLKRKQALAKLLA